MARVIAAGTFDPDFPRNRRLRSLLEHAGHEIVECRVDLWGVDRPELPNQPKAAILGRALVAFPRLAWKFLRVPRGDVVFVQHPGGFDMLVLGVLARLRRMPVVYDIFISLSDTVVSDRKLAGERSVVARLLRFVDRTSLRLAHRVIADTPPDADFFALLAGIPRDRIGVVWLGAQDDVFHPVAGVEPVARRVLFHGTFIGLQGLPTIIRAAKLLEDDDVSFRIVGTGQEQAVVDELIAHLRPRNVELVGRVPLEQIRVEIASATLCLGIFGTSDKARRVVPNKLFECLAVGRPVLTGDTPAVRSALSDTEVATAGPGDPDAVAREIRRLLADSETLEKIAAAGHARYAEAFATEPLSRALDAELKAVLSARR